MNTRALSGEEVALMWKIITKKLVFCLFCSKVSSNSSLQNPVVDLLSGMNQEGQISCSAVVCSGKQNRGISKKKKQFTFMIDVTLMTIKQHTQSNTLSSKVQLCTIQNYNCTSFTDNVFGCCVKLSICRILC